MIVYSLDHIVYNEITLIVLFGIRYASQVEPRSVVKDKAILYPTYKAMI